MKKTLVFFSVSVGMMLCILTGCKNKEVYVNSYSPQAQAQAAKDSKLLSQFNATCSCPSINPGSCSGSAYTAINSFLGGNSSVVKTVTWTTCGTADPLNNSNANCNSILNFTSQVKLCMISCTQVNATFFGKPACIPCYPDTFCIKLNAVNNTSTHTLSGSVTFNANEPNSTVFFEIVISADPNVVIKCNRFDSGSGLSYNYSCYGYFM